MREPTKSQCDVIVDNDRWIRDRLPEEVNGHSKSVRVLLNIGKEDKDFTIDGKWVWHCISDKVGGYPIAWREN